MASTIQIRVIPNAKKNEIKKIGSGYKVYLTVPPADGKANKALIDILSNYLKVKKSQLSIIKGLKSKDKIILKSC